MKKLFFLFMLLIGTITAQAQDMRPFTLADVIGRGSIDGVYWPYDGQTIAVTTAAGVWLYQADDLSQTPRYLPFEGPVTVAFDPSGPTMAVAEEVGVGLYDLNTGERFSLLKGGAVYSVLAFKPDGNSLAAVVDPEYTPVRELISSESFIHIWGIYSRDFENAGEGGLPLSIYITPDMLEPRAVAFHPNGKELAVVTSYIGGDHSEWEFFMLDLVSGDVLTEMEFMGDLSDNYQMTDARLVVSPYTMLRYFAAFDPEPERFGIEILTVDQQDLRAYALSPNAQMSVVKRKNTLEIRDTRSGEIVAALPVSESKIIAFSPDNHRIALVSEGRLSVYNIAQLANNPAPCGETSPACITYTDDHLPQPIADNSRMTLDDGLVISPSGQWEIVSGYGDETGYHLVNRLNDTAVKLNIDADSPYVRYIAFNPSESLVAVSFTTYYLGGTDDNVVRIWDLRDEMPDSQPIATLPHNAEMGPLIFSPDGALLATTSTNGDVFIWDTVTWSKAAALPHPRQVYQLAFSEDGKTLTTLASDGLVRVWR